MMMMMVQETKDPAIKLFGKEIPLSSSSSSSEVVYVEHEYGDEEPADETETKKRSSTGASETTRRSSIIDDASLDSVTVEAAAADQGGTMKPKSSKTMKKPDEILPCPRCNSTNTKFCYYNNYNVNQPRHFCRSCQRYWTAGGNMRTMLVGAGRRKTKSLSSHYRHISISEALQAVETDAASSGIRRPGLECHDGTVLNFGGIDPPILDSTASILNGRDKKTLHGSTSRFCGPKSGKLRFTNSNGEDCDNCSGDSTVSALSSNDEGAADMNFHPHIPGIPGIPWPYPWNYPAVLPPSTPSPAGLSAPFYQPAFLNCSFLSNWNLPSLAPSHGVPNSPTGELLNSENPMKRRNTSVLVPKTLRVYDPKEAAKSTIWSTLGIEKDPL